MRPESKYVLLGRLKYPYVLFQDTSGMPSAHYDDVIMTTMASQITSLTVVYSSIYSAADQRKHQSSALLAFCAGNSPGRVNSPHKGPVTRKMFPFDDVIMHYPNQWLFSILTHIDVIRPQWVKPGLMRNSLWVQAVQSLGKYPERLADKQFSGLVLNGI